MPSDPRKLLYDVATASAAIQEFCQGRSIEDYKADRMLRSACERQFEIIGEAMTRVRDRHPDVFREITEGQAIISFRNRPIHGYDTVDSAIVWDVIRGKLANLETVARRLLGEPG